MPPTDPARYGLYQQVLEVKEILYEVAGALERRAGAETDANHRAALLALAQWIRRRLHHLWIDGPPGTDDPGAQR